MLSYEQKVVFRIIAGRSGGMWVSELKAAGLDVELYLRILEIKGFIKVGPVRRRWLFWTDRRVWRIRAY